MLALILAFISFIGWGTGDVFSTLSSRKIGSISLTFWACVFGIIIFSFYIPYALPELAHYTLPLLLLNLGIGMLSLIGNLTFNEGLRVGVPSLVGTIGASFTAVTIILSVIFFHDHIEMHQIGIIGIIFLGVIISSLDVREFAAGKAKVEKGIVLAVVAMLCWGIDFTLMKILFPYVGWFWPIYFTLWLFPIVYLYTRIRKEKIISPFKKSAILPIVLSTLLLRSGDLSFNYAIGKGFTAISGAIAGAAPVLFVILALIFFQEKPKRQQLVGIVITLCGIVLLTIFS